MRLWLITLLLTSLTRALAADDLAAWRKGAEEGDLKSQYQLGARLSAIAQDTNAVGEAIYWLDRAGTNGHVGAQICLGYLYQSFPGIKSESNAFKWFNAAAAQGDVRGQLEAASCYENGVGVARNREKGVELLRAAAQSGNGEAQLRLFMLLQGTSPEEAMRWALKAANNGETVAQVKVAAAYEFGKAGFKIDRIEAFKWLLVVTNSGDLSIKQLCEEFGKGLSAKERTQAEERAKAFLKASKKKGK